jgi:hypothetical protein
VLDDLGTRLEELAGQAVDLQLAIERDLTVDEIQYVGENLVHQGVDVHFVEMRSRPWPHTLRLAFTQPDHGVGFLLPLLAIAATLGGVGIFGYTAWKAGTLMDKITENLIPIIMITSGTIILSAYALRR